jgi:hypothetical protein
MDPVGWLAGWLAGIGPVAAWYEYGNEPQRFQEVGKFIDRLRDC